MKTHQITLDLYRYSHGDYCAVVVRRTYERGRLRASTMLHQRWLPRDEMKEALLATLEGFMDEVDLSDLPEE